ncbi:hypothetical protein HGA91_06655 [candidate division WWE3 bacterium]|nr:hypothetical protein [candidate division WWE3 bacterium]
MDNVPSSLPEMPTLAITLDVRLQIAFLIAGTATGHAELALVGNGQQPILVVHNIERVKLTIQRREIIPLADWLDQQLVSPKEEGVVQFKVECGGYVQITKRGDQSVITLSSNTSCYTLPPAHCEIIRAEIVGGLRSAFNELVASGRFN